MGVRGFIRGVFRRNQAPSVDSLNLASHIRDPATRAAILQLGSAVHVIVKALTEYVPEIGQHLEITDPSGVPVGWIGRKPPSPYDAWFKSIAIGGTDPTGVGAPFTADSGGTITFSGAAVNIRQVDIVGALTLTNNSPTAGKIAWSAFSLRFAGTTYSISGSNTNNKFAYWTVGASSLTTTDSFAPMNGRFLIFTNDSGTADEAYNKVANKAIVRDNLQGLLNGLAPQQPLYYAGINLFGFGGTATHLSESAAGGLLTMAIKVTTALTGGAAWKVNISIDGATARSFQVIQGGVFGDDALAGLLAGTGDGSSVGDYRVIGFYLQYNSSILITSDVNTTVGTGIITLQVFRGLQI